VSWPAALLALLVSHLVGDFLLQTEWQAVTKVGGLGEPRSRRALLIHVAMYTLAFVPALIWIGTERGAGRAIAIAALVAVPHLLVDDGHLVKAWLHEVKRAAAPERGLAIAVDQTFHILCLLGAALVAAA
jgi:hypothetical protein